MSLTVLLGFLLFRQCAQAYKDLPSTAMGEPIREEFEAWQEFVSPEGRFKVLLPGHPQHASEQVPTPVTGQALDYEMYAIDDDQGASYMVSLITYPAAVDLTDTDAILSSIKDEMVVTNPGSKLQSMQLNQFNGHPAIDFTITNPEMQINSKVVLRDHTLYLVALIEKQGFVDPKKYQKFIESFQFTE